MAGRSPRTPGRCCLARPIRRSGWSINWPVSSGISAGLVATLIGQRLFGLALGYEDLNDHDELWHDPVMAVLAGKLTAAPLARRSPASRP